MLIQTIICKSCYQKYDFYKLFQGRCNIYVNIILPNTFIHYCPRYVAILVITGLVDLEKTKSMLYVYVGTECSNN